MAAMTAAVPLDQVKGEVGPLYPEVGDMKVGESAHHEYYTVQTKAERKAERKAFKEAKKKAKAQFKADKKEAKAQFKADRKAAKAQHKAQKKGHILYEVHTPYY